jgi:hypothetical protein
LEGSDHGLIGELSQHLPGRTGENHENLNQDNQCPRQDSNWTPRKDESIMFGSLIYSFPSFTVQFNDLKLIILV